MKIAVVDLETYWAVGHSLTKMSPIASIVRTPRPRSSVLRLQVWDSVKPSSSLASRKSTTTAPQLIGRSIG